MWTMSQTCRPATNGAKRERSRSPRRGRSRSPGRSARRRSYSDRSRSPGDGRDDYHRQRSPMSGAEAPGGGPGSGYSGGPQHRSFEERQAAKEQRMNNIRETSQQDRRVYVGNLSYDVKWHHLKDFMRQGKFSASVSRPRSLPPIQRLARFLWQMGDPGTLILLRSHLFEEGVTDPTFLQLERFSSPRCCSFQMECRRWAPTRSLSAGFLLWFPPFWPRWTGWIDGLGRCPSGVVGMRVSASFAALVRVPEGALGSFCPFSSSLANETRL